MLTEGNPKKRKAIEDFFKPEAKTTTRPPVSSSHVQCSNSPSLQPTVVPGLELHVNFVSSEEERTILKFLNDGEKCSWRTDLSRRTMHFGGTYCLFKPPCAGQETSATVRKPEVLEAPAMPHEFSWLIERFVREGVFRADQIPQYCIVNEYTTSQGIFAHTENFQFNEPVVGLSLLDTCPIRFLELSKPFDGSVRSGKAGKAEKTGRKADVQLPGRSLLVMRGQSRWSWQHEILRHSKQRGPGWKRISLTFRHKPEGKTKQLGMGG